MKASPISKPSEANRLLTDRAHRIGQEQPVFAYKLLVEGSIEERMLALQERKAALADVVLGHDEQAASSFSEEDLRGLLAMLPGSALNPTAADRAAGP